VNTKLLMKKNKFNLGDKVTSIEYPNREFEIVWIKDKDHGPFENCGISDGKIRTIAKVKGLSLLPQSKK
jgi:hypothetical protein